MKIFLYLAGFLPSFVWLLFYLRKDSHPESNWMVIKLFVFGMIAALAAVVLEKGFQAGESVFLASVAGASLISIFAGGALIEEYVKYFVVKIGGFRNKELDEPCDIMLYMIISALGFAALENILVLTNYHPLLTPAGVLEIMAWRFISATFLHALVSGLFGYFIAISFMKRKRRWLYFLTGLVLSTSLHGIYNWSIMTVEGLAKFFLPMVILVSLGYFVSYGFIKLKKMKSICSITR